ncbi:MAG: hypothetical protein AAFR15_17780, partial [Cyanobacteria bacterium J06627_15]
RWRMILAIIASSALIPFPLLHRDIKLLIMQVLQQSGLDCQEIQFTDPNGDIILVNPDQAEQARAIIREIRQAANHE